MLSKQTELTNNYYYVIRMDECLQFIITFLSRNKLKMVFKDIQTRTLLFFFNLRLLSVYFSVFSVKQVIQDIFIIIFVIILCGYSST